MNKTQKNFFKELEKLLQTERMQMLYLAMDVTCQILNGYESSTPRTRRAILEAITLIKDYAATHGNAAPISVDDNFWPNNSSDQNTLNELNREIKALEIKRDRAQSDARLGVPGAQMNADTFESQLNLKIYKRDSLLNNMHER